MSINKLPTIKSCYECGQFIGKEGIKNVIARSRFYKISIFGTTQQLTKVTKGYKFRSLIKHFKQSFSNSFSNDSQSINGNSKVDQARNNMSKTSQSNGVLSFNIAVLMKQNTSINLTCTWVKRKA